MKMFSGISISLILCFVALFTPSQAFCVDAELADVCATASAREFVRSAVAFCFTEKKDNKLCFKEVRAEYAKCGYSEDYSVLKKEVVADLLFKYLLVQSR